MTEGQGTLDCQSANISKQATGKTKKFKSVVDSTQTIPLILTEATGHRQVWKTYRITERLRYKHDQLAIQTVI